MLGLENLALESVLPSMLLDHSQEDINLEKPFLLVSGLETRARLVLVVSH